MARGRLVAAARVGPPPWFPLDARPESSTGPLDAGIAAVDRNRFGNAKSAHALHGPHKQCTPCVRHPERCAANPSLPYPQRPSYPHSDLERRPAVLALRHGSRMRFLLAAALAAPLLLTPYAAVPAPHLTTPHLPIARPA